MFGGGVDSLGSKSGLGRDFISGYNKIGGGLGWNSSSVVNNNPISHPNNKTSSLCSGDMKKVNEIYRLLWHSKNAS